MKTEEQRKEELHKRINFMVNKHIKLDGDMNVFKFLESGYSIEKTGTIIKLLKDGNIIDQLTQ